VGIIYFNLLRKKLTKDNNILNKKAEKNDSTKNPGTKTLTSKTINVLRTRAKRPRVKIVIGSVSNKSIGFKKVFRTPNTIEAIAAPNKSVLTPGTI